MYQDKEKKVVEQIRASYEEREESKVEKLKKFDRKVKLPSEIFAYSFGIIGSLVLGIGMCLAMKVIGNLVALGIVIGCVGIAMVSVNYTIYSKLKEKNKKKNSAKIMLLTEELLGSKQTNL